jgi:hypothetical protein
MAATTAKTPMVSATMNEYAEIPADVLLPVVGFAPLPPEVAEAPPEGATGAGEAGIRVGVVPLQWRPISVIEDA